MSYPSLLHPEPLPLWQYTVDPYLHRRYSNTVLSQSLWAPWVLVCTRFFWSLWASLVGMGFDFKCEFAPSTVLLCSLEGLMLKLKLQYFGHLMQKVDSLENTWCWDGLGAGGEGNDRGWDGWMASPIQWTWVWVNSGSWWWTGRPGVLRFMGLQRVGHDWATELNWTELNRLAGASPLPLYVGYHLMAAPAPRSCRLLQTMQYYWALIKNELFNPEKSWKNLRCVLLSERRQFEELT